LVSNKAIELVRCRTTSIKVNTNRISISPVKSRRASYKLEAWGTCSTPVRGVPYEPAAHALRP
jgi:hypothetical protein